MFCNYAPTIKYVLMNSKAYFTLEHLKNILVKKLVLVFEIWSYIAAVKAVIINLHHWFFRGVFRNKITDYLFKNCYRLEIKDIYNLKWKGFCTASYKIFFCKVFLPFIT